MKFIAGRGTNVLLEDDSISGGGLHVIVSKLPSQGRTLVQNIGRSSRQGQPGSAIIYVKPGDKFDESPEMNPSVVNLFRLQRKFERYLSENWPWLNAKTSVFTSESEPITTKF